MEASYFFKKIYMGTVGFPLDLYKTLFFFKVPLSMVNTILPGSLM